MNYEIVFNNKYLKIIRLKHGALVKIHKAKIEQEIGSCIKNKRKDLTKLDDNFYKTNVDITDSWNEVIFPKGTILYKENPCIYKVVGEILNKDKWYWELKTAGNDFSGDTEDFKLLIDTIDNIIDKEK